MGQWGREIQVGKARFLTHVETGHCFDPIDKDSVVESFILMNDGGDPVAAEAALADLNAKWLGKPYNDLPDMPVEVSEPGPLVHIRYAQRRTGGYRKGRGWALELGRF